MKEARPLNLKHLRYFAEVARRGSVTAAARALFLTPQTVSGQIQELEAAIGQPLFDRVGRKLLLTHAGETALDYAKAIFALGEELKTVLQGTTRARSIILRVGIADSVAKLQTISTLQSVIERHRNELELVCQEGSYADLLGRVGAGELDMVLSDSPVPSTLARSLHTLEIAQTGVSFMAASSVAGRLKGAFPQCLDQAPLLSSSNPGSALTQALDNWFIRQRIRPHVVGRIEDSALLKALAQSGLGVAVVPGLIEKEVAKQYRLRIIGRVADVRASLLLVRARGRRAHPLVAEIERAHAGSAAG
jgi:LysR family transcriptional regulator, transcriptional activator of nhaA